MRSLQLDSVKEANAIVTEDYCMCECFVYVLYLYVYVCVFSMRACMNATVNFKLAQSIQDFSCNSIISITPKKKPIVLSRKVQIENWIHYRM